MLRTFTAEAGIGDEPITVSVRALDPEEAIGSVDRTDFPIVAGKEAMIEAHVLSGRAQAFTDAPSGFRGPLKDIVERPLESNADRGLFIATLNALLAHLGMVRGTLHCRDRDPTECGTEIAGTIAADRGRIKVGLIGLNPAIAEALTNTLGRENVRVTDLNSQTVGEEKFGITIEDGGRANGDLIGWADLVLVTGTTLVNNTFDPLFEQIEAESKDYFLFGVTCSGICRLLGLERICPRGRD